jgi:hypothetical protein
MIEHLEARGIMQHPAEIMDIMALEMDVRGITEEVPCRP